MTKRGLDRYGAERAIKASDLPAPSRLLLFTLLTHVTNGTLTVPAKYAPTFSALGEESGLARGTLSKHLNQLEDDGWLVRNRPSKARAMHGHQRTGYEITPPVHLANRFTSRTGSADEPIGEPQVTASTGDEPVHETNRSGSRAEHSPTYRPTSSSPTEKKGGVGGNSKPRVKADPPGFAEWYAIYPKKHQRGAAVRAFPAALAKAGDVQTLIDGVKRYRDSRNVRRGFVQNPATWLNGECWLDDIDEPLADAYRPYRNPTDQSVYDEAI